jgi:hypothetical protein
LAVIPWINICAKFNSPNCTTSFQGTFYVGISKTGSALDEYITVKVNHRYASKANLAVSNTAGGYMTWTTDCTGASTREQICHFNVYPGDEKVFVTDFKPNGVNTDFSVPSLYVTNTLVLNPGSDASGAKYAFIRLYYSTDTVGKFASVTPLSPSQDMPFDPASGSISVRTATDLQNDTPYYFLAAAVDQTGIVSYFSKALDMTDTDYTANPIVFQQSATPGPVYGLLDGNKCFIATAAYGTEMAPQVEWLRKFRNRYLNTNPIGRAFVRTYYKLSPPIADFIAKHEWLRTMTRWTLWPMVKASEWLTEDGKKERNE